MTSPIETPEQAAVRLVPVPCVLPENTTTALRDFLRQSLAARDAQWREALAREGK